MKSFQRCALLLLAMCLTGCVMFPVPAIGKRVGIGTRRIKASDLTFVQAGRTTREDFELQVGKPWTNYTDLHVSVYYWEIVTGYWVFGLYLMGGGTDSITRMEILCIEFDESDLVKRFQIMRHPSTKSTREVVMAWLRPP